MTTQPGAGPRDNDLIDVVDDTDEPTGRRIARKLVFDEPVGFRVAHVLVTDQRDRLLLQRVGSANARSAHRWGSSVAAYVRAGETYAQAARRRMQEELGISAPISKVGGLRMLIEGSTKFIELFHCHSEVAEIVDDVYIEDLAYWDRAELAETVRTHPERFTSTFIEMHWFINNYAFPQRPQ